MKELNELEALHFRNCRSSERTVINYARKVYNLKNTIDVVKRIRDIYVITSFIICTFTHVIPYNSSTFVEINVHIF